MQWEHYWRNVNKNWASGRLDGNGVICALLWLSSANKKYSWETWMVLRRVMTLEWVWWREDFSHRERGQCILTRSMLCQSKWPRNNYGKQLERTPPFNLWFGKDNDLLCMFASTAVVRCDYIKEEKVGPGSQWTQSQVRTLAWAIPVIS